MEESTWALPGRSSVRILLGLLTAEGEDFEGLHYHRVSPVDTSGDALVAHHLVAVKLPEDQFKGACWAHGYLLFVAAGHMDKI